MAQGSGTAVLTPRLIKDISGKFFVPAYQRGYRWGSEEVERLLTDIVESRSDSYYLQPVVVKSMGEAWELIDGQQRLTTLYLIIRYLRSVLPVDGFQYSIEYETRPDSAAYLDSLDEETSGDNIDYFHMHQAFATISKWFEERPDGRLQAAIDMHTAFVRKVKVIWYEADQVVNSSDLFTRLNVGRIPLTDAELVKALLLSEVRNSKPERVHEVAAQWDSIERDLRAPEVWAFVSGKHESQASHIGLLLAVMANTTEKREVPLFHTFEELRPRIVADPLGFWDEVVGMYSQVMGWHNDRELFHRIGYLINSGRSLIRILELAKGQTKSGFKERLVEAIRDHLNLTESQLLDLDYRSSRSLRALLLMNVETVLRSPHSTERYSFDGHARGRWSLEHIHAQQAETLNTEAQWREWLRLQLEAMGGVPGCAEVADELAASVPDESVALRERDFEALRKRIQQAWADAGQPPDDDVDAIANLALLDASDNSALSNSVFEVKRREIIRRDQAGHFIPICTRNVFLKYYTPASKQQIHFWGPDDRASYLEALRVTLREFLREGASDD